MQFQTGKQYTTRSIGDADCRISVTVAKRTAKTITTSEGKTLRIAMHDGKEFVKPWGSYSMAPMIRADDAQ